MCRGRENRFGGRWIVLLLLVLFDWSSYGIVQCTAAPIIGIDFGTEWLKIASTKPGSKIDIVLNEHARRRTPALVGFTDEGRVFGENALLLLSKAPFLVGTDLKALQNYSKLEDIVDPAFSYLRGRGLAYGPLPLSVSAGSDDEYLGRLLEHEIESDDANPVRKYSVAELSAMIFEYAKQLVSHEPSGGGRDSVKDCVITVPPHFAQGERQAILDAAAIVNLNVLSLIDDGVAVALSYAMGRRKELVSSQIIVFYDVGAFSSSATIVRFDPPKENASDAEVSEKAKGKRTKKEKPGLTSLTVLGMGWDRSLGGLSFDSVIVDHLVSIFNEKLRGKALDIRSSPRAMSKLYLATEKARRTLTTNAETSIFLEELFAGYDFHYVLYRSKMEELASRAGLYDRLAQPLISAFQMAQLQIAKQKETSASGDSDTADSALFSPDSVVLFGGAARMPRVQAVLSELVGKPVDRHVNMEEAAAVGAAFHAATLSTQFFVQRFPLVTIAGRGVSVRWLASEGRDEETYSLFSPTRGLPARKQMIFNRVEDLSFVLQYDEPPVEVIAEYVVSGVQNVLKSVNCTSKPKVVVTFRYDTERMTGLTVAELQCEEEVVVEKVKQRNASAEDTKVAASDSDGIPENEQQNRTETLERTVKTRNHRIPLKVNVTKRGLSPADIRRSQGFLREVMEADMEIRLTQEARNSLETFLYSVGDALSELKENADFALVVSDEQLSTFDVTYRKIEDWNDDFGSTAQKDDFTSRLNSLTVLFEGMRLRLAEFRLRPIVVNDTFSALNATEEVVKKLKDLNDSRSPVRISEWEDVLYEITRLRSWLDFKVSEQEGRSSFENPVFRAEEVEERWGKIQRRFLKLMKRPLKKLPPNSGKSEEGSDAPELEAVDKEGVSEEKPTESTEQSNDQPIDRSSQGRSASHE